MIARPSAIVNRLANDRAAIVGYHRFLNNPKVCYHAIMEGHFDSVIKKTIEKDLVCIQDTCEYVYEHHKGILKEGTLGTVSDNKSAGVRVHPMLVLDAQDEFAYGFSSFEIINRKDRTKDRHQRNYKSLEIEEKESYRWLEAIYNTKILLDKAKSLTIVSDRESDIFELWSRVPDLTTHLVIRTSFTRRFQDEHEKDITPTNPSNSVGFTRVIVPSDSGKKRKSREAKVELFVQKAWTKKPNSRKQQGSLDADRVGLYVVTAREVVNPLDKISEPIEWILLTDIKTETLEDADKIISIYKSRWNIEQIFRLTKQKGFELEASQLETGYALENLIALVFIAAIKVFQMVKSRNDEQRRAIDIFDDEEAAVLTKLNKGVEGKTERSKNRNAPGSLAYIIWIVARLGNWKPEDRDPPGPITLLEGWKTLHHYIRLNKIASG